MHPTASIIIPAHNRRDLLLALLASVVPQARAAEAQVIVADDASSDGTAEAVAAAFLDVKVLSISEQVGPSAARNKAAAQARAPLLLFLDSDGEAAPDWLMRMLSAYDEGRVLLGNVVDFEGGRVQGVPRRATFLGKSLRCWPSRGNTGPSCNLGVPQALFQALGGFDEELPYYFEDSDLCIRAQRAGATFCFVEDAVFRHHGTERKRGDAIRLQEHNSTYAMLKLYGASSGRRRLFLLLNGAWVALRMARLRATGRGKDSRRLWVGFRTGIARFKAYRERSGKEY